MRKSISISNSTKHSIEDIRNTKYKDSRVTSSYIISNSLKNNDKKIERKLDSDKTHKLYQSVKYTLDHQSNEILEEFMNKGYTADAIINAALMCDIENIKNEERLRIFKRRYELLKNKHCTFKGANSEIINMMEYLPLIYAVFISNRANPVERHCIYTGKSLLFANRCTTHIVSVIDDPSYFGLTDEDLLNDNLLIEFEIVDEVKIEEIDTYEELVEVLADKEKGSIKRLKPATQKGMNMIADSAERRLKVKAIIDNIFKN